MSESLARMPVTITPSDLPTPRHGDAPYTISMVCTGNICRSAMAEIVLIDRLTAAGVPTSGRTGVVVTEGNYLALETRGWGAARERIDLLIHIDVPEEVLVPRLINRHENFGRNALDAGHWVRTVDLPNARLIATSVHRCDEVWREPEDEPDSDDELE